MRVGELRIGDEVEIKLSHWVAPMYSRVLSRQAAHCQLHGDYMHEETTFRKVKNSGKESYMYNLADHTEPEILTLAPVPTGQKK